MPATLAVPANADFGFERLAVTFTEEDGSEATQAGSHPFAWTTALSMKTIPGEIPDQDLRDLRIQLPPGLVGSPALMPRCSHSEFRADACPPGTAVGTIELETSLAETEEQNFSLYNLNPRAGTAAELAFTARQIPVAIEVAISPHPPHNLVAAITGAPQVVAFYGSVLSIYGTPGGVPFLTLPRSCAGPPATVFEAASWQNPGAWVASAPVLASDGSEPEQPVVVTGCSELAFAPAAEARPTTTLAQTPSGLDFGLDVDDDGLTSASGLAQSDIKGALITMPQGMTLNPSVATGLGVCAREDLKREAAASVPGEGCPDASRIGTVRADTPLLDDPLSGSLFVAKPDDAATPEPGAENPFDALLAVYLVFKDPARGVILKQAARVEPDPRTGRLTFALDGLPQLPLSHLDLQFRGGPRGPLASPAACGSYEIRYLLTPWSGTAPLASTTSFKIDGGCEAGGFAPVLSAGTTDPVAGEPSPFVLGLSRRDGEQNVSAATVTLPPGLTAKLAGVPLCDSAAAATGACPPASRVGSVRVSAGVGSVPVSVPAEGEKGSATYLAGPYKGAPFSFVVVVPARVGPFDLGTVVSRAGVHLDPRTAQATVRLDPLPQILEGVPIEYRTIRLLLDRPGFVGNPTSCAASAVRASVTSSAGTTAAASSRFQVGRCARLGFRPKASLRFLGPTHRGAHPRFRVVVRARRGDANIGNVAITLPDTELLDNRHIDQVCGSRRFAAAACPPGSVFGRARVWTPLLDRPIEGPVYLRSSQGKLPELVASLDGRIQLDLTARVDSVHGRLRTTVRRVPDLPLSKVVLTLQGGRRGLLVHSGGVCDGRLRARAGFLAHNGKAHSAYPLVKTSCGPQGQEK